MQAKLKKFNSEQAKIIEMMARSDIGDQEAFSWLQSPQFGITGDATAAEWLKVLQGDLIPNFRESIATAPSRIAELRAELAELENSS